MKSLLVVVISVCAVHICLAGNIKRREPRATDTLDSFVWRNCPGFDQSASPWRIRRMDVSPMPLIMPGQALITYRSTSSRPVNNVNVNLNIVKETRLVNFRIPCIMELGSCTYENTCDMLIPEEGVEPEPYVVEMRQMLRANNLSDTCPIQARPMNIRNYAFTIPPLPSYIGFAVTGNYNITIDVRESETDLQLACVNMRVGMEEAPEEEEPCTGWFCSLTG